MNSQNRIAHILLSLEIGGLEVHVAKMVAYQKSKGATLHVLCLDNKGELATQLERQGISVVLFKRKPGKMDRQVLSSIRTYISKHKITSLHTHNFEPYMYGTLSTLFKKKIPLVHSQHGIEVHVSRFKKLFVRASLLLKPSLVAVSSSVESHMRSFGWWLPSTSQTILNGVDTNEFQPKPAQQADLKSKFGYQNNAFIVICVARLAPVKDHDTLISNFSAFAEHHPQAKLLIVGDGPSREHLEKCSAQLKSNKEQIHFLGERTDIVELLLTADIFMMTSISEGISISLLEGMSSGLVPIVTDVGGNSEIITHGQNGFLFESKNTLQGTQLLEEIFKSKLLKCEISINARQTVETRFSFKTMMNNYNPLHNI